MKAHTVIVGSRAAKENIAVDIDGEDLELLEAVAKRRGIEVEQVILEAVRRTASSLSSLEEPIHSD